MSVIQTKLAGVINVEDVRHYMFDRTLADNPIELDLEFSDEEIGHAMRFAALAYNETPPMVHTVDPAQLPFGNVFLNGIAYHLYLGKWQKLTRADVDYSAGNLTVELNKRRIDHLSKFTPFFQSEFKTGVVQQKAAINISLGYRAFTGRGLT